MESKSICPKLSCQTKMQSPHTCNSAIKNERWSSRLVNHDHFSLASRTESIMVLYGGASFHMSV